MQQPLGCRSRLAFPETHCSVWIAQGPQHARWLDAIGQLDVENAHTLRADAIQMRFEGTMHDHRTSSDAQTTVLTSLLVPASQDDGCVRTAVSMPGHALAARTALQT